MPRLPVDGQVCEPDVGVTRLVTAADPAASICPNKQDRVECEWSVPGVIAVLATSPPHHLTLHIAQTILLFQTFSDRLQHVDTNKVETLHDP